MILSEALLQINASFRGSDDDVPTAATPDYTLWLLTINRKIREWARDPKNKWKSLYDIQALTPVVGIGVQTYNLPNSFLRPSDKVIVTTTSGKDITYRVVEPQERYRYYNAVFVSNSNPQTLTFYNDIIANDQIVGGTIRVPGYFIPADLVSLTDIVPVDDPDWLVYGTASELAFNDLTYESKYVDLNSKANNLYSMMAHGNRSGTNNNPRVAQTRVPRIMGTSGGAWNDRVS